MSTGLRYPRGRVQAAWRRSSTLLDPRACHGGFLVFAEAWQRKDPRQLADLIRRSGVQLVVATPSILELILDAAGGPLSELRVAVCMGEGLLREAAERIYDRAGPGVSLYNFYGSTETENSVFPVPAPNSRNTG